MRNPPMAGGSIKKRRRSGDLSDIAKAYYDANGFLAKTVFVVGEANYDHTQHDEPGLTGIVLVNADYKNTAPSSAINGLAYSASLHAMAAAKVAASSPVLSAKILSNNADPDAATLAKFNAIMLTASPVVIGP